MTGRIPISNVQPVVACGRYPAKAVVGERFTVSATVFREGHDAVAANVVLRDADGRKGPWTPMRKLGPGVDVWEAEVVPTSEGRWSYAIEAWSDPYETWHHDAGIKVPAGLDVELMLEEGARLLERAATVPGRSATGKRVLADAAAALRDTGRPVEARYAAATAPEVEATLQELPLRDLVTSTERFPLQVDRERALFSSWYELFPRSEGASMGEDGGPKRSGTFRQAAERLPAIAGMGFDIVYLPPIHPIGFTARKGPNNTLTPAEDDPGVPWAIGSPAGGHDAVHPDLGTIEDFDFFVARTRELGMEVALDLALQASPDHPWVTEHPEWFTTRADGTIAYAENPPKKYQDIYPINFDNDPQGIYNEVLRVVRHWISHGVRVFRVDNPHTKPVNFWEWLLGEVRKTDPDVLFLAEAFTRPAMMQELAKVGFHQSYTYFTWRNTKQELVEYLTELTTQTAHFYRPNFWPNTPDILHAYLQYGGPAAFKIRAVLAATMTPSYGIYSGYELYEHVAVRPGSEEYLDSEKYQYRPRDWAAAERDGRTLTPYLTLLNRLRREHVALQRLRGLRFHETDSDHILAYSKVEKAADGSEDVVLVVVNLDPHSVREDTVHLDMPELGFGWDDHFAVRDEITGETFWWGQHNYVRLDPYREPAHILTVRRV
ncbi:alpha-1,4-glucan--maltose-1-phosphate maltosyltransferase [Motilibacter aurantiacus]|uniref:alpha-1,4-glucan--maltose-1-phosphate maltosyltransferase n=1 Tax=Motilibacter aurantiacus TaxID=2714955 RepID=UPI00140C47CE|nr:alpha-1,4-glucan--maltose-1-phosphate maltosyltransferase [Motilibacter aurantiacus]NHC44722.1 alpha-1,4-glucan--maltose-1-phosphate maltosyltransferase [Motilibacter aurantiacus]